MTYSEKNVKRYWQLQKSCHSEESCLQIQIHNYLGKPKDNESHLKVTHQQQKQKWKQETNGVETGEDTIQFSVKSV